MDNPIENDYDPQRLEMLVARIMSIEDITFGSTHVNPLAAKHPTEDRFAGGTGYLVRYRGKIRSEDTAAAYDVLAESLKPFHFIPLFRWDQGRHSVLIIPDIPRPPINNRWSFPWLNLILFILTLVSVLFTGALYGSQEPWPSSPLAVLVEFFRRGWPFAVSILAILGSHELGHYFMGRHHGVQVSLPYFIPLPLSPFGTMGAFINMREIPKNRRVLLDIGMAGPLVGFLVALPILWIGLQQSGLSTLPLAPTPNMSLSIEGNSIIYLLFKFLIFGQLLPAPAQSSLPVGLYWLQYFFTGTPFPFGGTDVMLNSVAWAGWAGLLVTAMNLIPAGQLDGGHVFYVLFGSKTAKRIVPFIIGALVLLGLVWNGWWLWAVLIYFLGRQNAELLDEITTIDNKRKILAVLALLVFILTFTPVPLSIM